MSHFPHEFSPSCSLSQILPFIKLFFEVVHFLRYKIAPVVKCIRARTHEHLQTCVDRFKVATTEASGLFF